MGYEVKIINTEKSIDDSQKIFNKIGKICPILTQQFNFFEEDDYVFERSASIDFFLNGDDEQVLSFDVDDKLLWAKNPSEEILAVMIEIAKAFNDGSRVLGDELETYIITQGVCYHEYENRT